MPEWLKGADCKSAGSGLRGFESLSHHILFPSPLFLEAGGRQFQFLPNVLPSAAVTVVAQLVEQRIPNPQVGGSIPSDRALSHTVSPNLLLKQLGLIQPL